MKSITESQTDESDESSYHRALQLKIDYPGTMSLLDSNGAMSQVDSYGAIGDIGDIYSNGAKKGIPSSLNDGNGAVSTENCDIGNLTRTMPIREFRSH